jgi:hypothetical protein
MLQIALDCEDICGSGGIAPGDHNLVKMNSLSLYHKIQNPEVQWKESSVRTGEGGCADVCRIRLGNIVEFLFLI